MSINAARGFADARRAFSHNSAAKRLCLQYQDNAMNPRAALTEDFGPAPVGINSLQSRKVWLK
jgi:hypothetical protein